MDALKRAELAKQQGQRDSATPDLTMESTLPADTGTASPATLPALPSLEDLDAEFIAHANNPAAQAKEPPPSTAPGRNNPPARTATPAAGVETERAAIRNAFATKGRGGNDRRGILIAAAVGMLVVGGIGTYFWLQFKPTQSLATARPSMGTEATGGSFVTPPPGRDIRPAANAEAPALAATRAEQPTPEDEEEEARQAHRAAPSPRTTRRPATLPMAETPIRVTTAQTGVDPSVAEGYRLLQTGNLTGARAAYVRALHTDPRNADALHGIAAISLREGKAGDAEVAYQRILEANPADPAAQAGLVGLNAQTDPVSGENRMKSLLAAQGDLPVVNFALGNLYSRQQRWNEAQQAYFKAVTGDAGNPDYLFNLAVSLDQLHQPKLAAQYYDQALTATKARAAAFDRALATQRLRELRP
jgi:tetratricopeptide (TPR) repeat protein